MLSETVDWEEGEVLPLNYKESDIPMNGTYKPVRLPTELTGDLAEEIGMHISDGTMSKLAVNYCGHEDDDGAYLRYRVLPLLKRIWGIKKVSWKAERDNKCLKLLLCSRRIVIFKEKVLGLPCGAKEGIQIPEIVMKRHSLVERLMSGLFDGDGSLSFKSKWGLGHTYPVISYSSSSEPLMRQLQRQLRGLGFVIPKKLWERNDGTWFLAINGDRNYERWMNTVGFNNPKHLTKVVLYERFGMVPPETGLRERMELIRGEIKLSKMYPLEHVRVNNNRVVDKKVLKALKGRVSSINALGRRARIDGQCVRTALRRLSKMGLVECVRYQRGGKKYYRITQWGLNKLNRVETIVKRLREEFQLAV